MTKNISYSVDTRYSLDFSGLPIRETAAMLRRLALFFLDQLLDASCSPGKSLEPVPPPDLLKALPKEEVRIMRRSKIWKILDRFPYRRIPRNVRDKLPKAFKKMTQKAIKGKLKANKWQIAANNRFALAVGGTRGNTLPDDIWPVAAHMAWKDPNFQLEVSLKITQWLRHRTLISPDTPKAILFSPNTFWLMILLAKLKPPKVARWFSSVSRARVRLAKGLQEEAAVETMTNEWAGFWDQWLIDHMTRRWPDAFKQLPLRLCKAISALPYLNIPPTSQLCKGKKRKKLFSRSIGDKWFDMLDGIKRFKRPSKDFRKAVMLNVCHKNYKEQIPEFLAPHKTHRDKSF